MKPRCSSCVKTELRRPVKRLTNTQLKQYWYNRKRLPLANVRNVLRNLGRKLGEGRYGKVMQVFLNCGMGVVKIAKPGQGGNLLKEMRYLCQLDGVGGAPQVVGVTLKPIPMMVTNFCGTHTLNEVCVSDSIPIHYKVLCIKEAAWKLKAVNEAGVAHNDVKGDNILVDLTYGLMEPPVVNIIDFGLATDIGGNLGLNPDPEAEKKSFHLAPELWQRGASTAASEMYSFGIFLQRASGDLVVDGFYIIALLSLSAMATKRDPAERPTIDYVISVLEDTIEELPNILYQKSDSQTDGEVTERVESTITLSSSNSPQFSAMLETPIPVASNGQFCPSQEEVLHELSSRRFPRISPISNSPNRSSSVEVITISSDS